MPKELTAEMHAALAEEVKHPLVFFEGHFLDGVLRLWSGIGTLSWDDQEWYGAGDLGRITQLPDAAGLEAQSMKVELRGVDLENISLALSQVKQRNPAHIYVGFADKDWNVIPNPYHAFSGMMDVPQITEDGKTVSISLTLESRAKRILQKKERRRTHEDQQIRFPGDRGLEYVASLQDAQIKWK